MSNDAIKWERERFFEAASLSAFPNEMQFEIARKRRSKDETFSKDALNSTMDNIENFVLARLKAEWDRRGIAPQEMSVEVKVSFGKNKTKAKLEAGNTPWWQLSDPETGLLSIDSDSMDDLHLDGEHRTPEGNG